MYGAPYIFYFVPPIVKTVEMMVQRVNFERNLKNIRPATVHLKYQKYPKKLKPPFFSAPGGAGTKRTIIWFKLQPQMII